MFPFRKITIASKKYQPETKRAPSSIRNAGTALATNSSSVQAVLRHKAARAGKLLWLHYSPYVYSTSPPGVGAFSCLTDPTPDLKSLRSRLPGLGLPSFAPVPKVRSCQPCCLVAALQPSLLGPPHSSSRGFSLQPPTSTLPKPAVRLHEAQTLHREARKPPRESIVTRARSLWRCLLHSAAPPPAELPGKLSGFFWGKRHFPSYSLHFVSKPEKQSLICFYCSFWFLKCNLPLRLGFST